MKFSQFIAQWKQNNKEIEEIRKAMPKQKWWIRQIGIWSGYYGIFGPPEFRKWCEVKKLSDKK